MRASEVGITHLLADRTRRASERGAEASAVDDIPRSLVGGDRFDFDVLDADGDGSVDRREAGAVDRYLLREFDRTDTNRDGRLDREELAGWIL